MLSREGNAGEWWKTAIGLFSKKKSNFARAAHFFCTFLCRCFARLQRETSGKFLVARVMEEMSYVFSFTFFLLPLIIILHWWLQPSLFCHRRYKIFMLFFQQKKVSFVFFSLALDLCRPFSRWASLACSLTFTFSPSFSCSRFQICGHAGQWN